MENFLKLWGKSVVHARLFIIAAALLVLGLAGSTLSRLYYEDSTDMWFLANDPILTTYQGFKKTFQNDDFLVVGIEARESDPDIFTPEMAQLVVTITDFLDGHRNVSKVRSLSRYQYMHESEGMLKVDDLIPAGEEYTELPAKAWRNFATIMRKEALGRNLIVTEDLRNTMISARIIEPNENDGNPKLAVAQEFLAFVKEQGLDQKGFTLHYSGSAMINESYFRCSTDDQAKIYPIMLCIMLLLLAVLFRSWNGVIFPALIVIFSVVVTLGITALMGWPLNMLNIMLPTLLTVIGLGDSIHVLVGFNRFRSKGLEPKEAASEATRTLFMPCLYTTVTTCIGFMALSVSQLSPVIEFGIEAGIGVLVAFFFSITLLPALLSFVKAPPRAMNTGWVAAVSDAVPSIAMRYNKSVVAGFLLLLILSLTFLLQIQSDTSFERNFHEEFPIRTATHHFDSAYGGALSLEIWLDSGRPGGAKEPEFLKQVHNLQHYLEGHEGTGRALSLNDYLMEINQTIHDDDSAYYRVPNSRELTSQLLLLYSNAGPEEDLSDLLSFDERMLRMSILFKSRPASITRKWIHEIENHITTNFPDLKAQLTGRTILFNNMDIYVLNGLIASFSLSASLIILCFFVLLRSFKYGILAMIPSIFPIIVAGGVMGFFNIYLDFATMMVAAITIGIAVDDTVHFLWRYVRERRQGSSQSEAVHTAVQHAGRAIILTSLILCCGFSMLIFSTFIPNIYFGVLGGVIVIVALLGDILILPALITCLRSKSKVDASDPVLPTAKEACSTTN